LSTLWKRWALALTAVGVLLMAGEWILLVAGVKPHEMIVGAAAILCSTLFLHCVHSQSTLRLDFRAKDIAAGWRIPWYVLRGCWQITAVLFRDLFTSQRAGSFYRVSGFATSKQDPRLVARRVLATFYTTATPNFIIIGIDFNQSRLLFHQIDRGSVPAMTRQLGANS
jgi:hypothetical protein